MNQIGRFTYKMIDDGFLKKVEPRSLFVFSREKTYGCNVVYFNPKSFDKKMIVIDEFSNDGTHVFLRNHKGKFEYYHVMYNSFGVETTKGMSKEMTILQMFNWLKSKLQVKWYYCEESSKAIELGSFDKKSFADFVNFVKDEFEIKTADYFPNDRKYVQAILSKILTRPRSMKARKSIALRNRSFRNVKSKCITRNVDTRRRIVRRK